MRGMGVNFFALWEKAHMFLRQLVTVLKVYPLRLQKLFFDFFLINLIII